MTTGVQALLGTLAPDLFKLVDELFTSDEERMVAKIKLMELAQAGDLAQIGVNAKEAESQSWFVAGWRPAVGWVCTVAFSLIFVVFPLISFVGGLFGHSVPLPEFDTALLLTVLGGMLGLSGTRTIEKITGVAREVAPGGVDRRASAAK